MESQPQKLNSGIIVTGFTKDDIISDHGAGDLF